MRNSIIKDDIFLLLIIVSSVMAIPFIFRFYRTLFKKAVLAYYGNKIIYDYRKKHL